MKKLLFFLLIVSQNLLPEGFAAGTLVNVRSGYIPIEQVKEGNAVGAVKSDTFVGSGLNSYSTCNYVDEFIQLTIGDECISVAPDQLFHSATHGWMKAADLKKGDFITNWCGVVEVDNVERIKLEAVESKKVYTLFVEDPGVFFVTKQALVVFNSPYSVYRSLKKCGNNSAEALSNVADALPTIVQTFASTECGQRLGQKMLEFTVKYGKSAGRALWQIFSQYARGA